MPEPLRDPLTLVAAVAAFAFVLALWTMGILVVASRRAARARLLRERLEGDGEAPEARVLRLWHEGGEATTAVPRAARAGLGARLEALRVEAGYRPPVRALLLRLAAVSAAAGLLGLAVSGRPTAAVVLAAAVPVAAWLVTGRRVAKRQALFEQQLVDGLELSARALRAGHPLLGAFRLIGQEIPAPVGTIFAEIVQQQEMGTSLEVALRRAANASSGPDLKLFTASMAVNLRTGGNLAEVVEGLAKVIRARIRLSRRFRVLTAQTQFSKKVLLFLPVALFLVLHVLNPEYAGELTNTRPGLVMAGVAAGLLLTGWWIMNRMAQLQG